MRDVTKYCVGIIGARSSALLTDMVVLVITIWKARLVQAPGVKLSVKFTVADSLMQDGTYEPLASYLL